MVSVCQVAPPGQTLTPSPASCLSSCVPAGGVAAGVGVGVAAGGDVGGGTTVLPLLSSQPSPGWTDATVSARPEESWAAPRPAGRNLGSAGSNCWGWSRG